MNRPFVISLAAFYLLVSLGLTINVHYCMGEVEEVSIIAMTKGCCCAAMEMPGCCDDEQLQLSLDDDHQLPQPIEMPSPIGDLPEQVSFLLESDGAISETSSLAVLPQPPPPSGPPAWIWYCSPIFYG